MDFTPQQLRGELAHFKQIRDAAIKHFHEVREDARNLRKKPATAELLAWLQILLSLDLNVSDLDKLNQAQLESLALSYSVLAKSREDMMQLKKAFIKGG